MSKVTPSPNLNPDLVLLPDLAAAYEAATGKRSPSYQSFWQMIASGQLPAERIDGRIRVSVQLAIKTLAGRAGVAA